MQISVVNPKDLKSPQNQWHAGRDSRAAFGGEGSPAKLGHNPRPSGSKADPDGGIIEEFRFSSKMRVNPDPRADMPFTRRARLRQRPILSSGGVKLKMRLWISRICPIDCSTWSSIEISLQDSEKQPEISPR